MRLHAALFAMLFLAADRRSQAQTLPVAEAMIRIHVVDTTRVGVPSADISIVRGLNEIIGHGTTDNQGRVAISVPRIAGDLQVSVRKLGYQPFNEFFALSNEQVTSLETTLRRSVQTLAPVATTAREDAKRKSYHADADLIANSDRPLYDAMDIVTKLLPDVIEGREGKGSGCGIQDVWVNGIRVVYPPTNEMVMSRIGYSPPAPPKPGLVMQSGGASGRVVPHSPLTDVDSSVWLALATVKPEHIAEMTYEDCYSTTVTDHTHATNALFIVLKPGVGYDAGRGSYVLSDDDPKNKSRKQQAAAAPAPPQTVSSTWPGYRARLAGVFDATSGNPIEGASVTDSATGVRAETTVTGTVTLAFLPAGPSVLRISKPGYVDERQEILISVRDSFPLTIVLNKARGKERPIGTTDDARAGTTNNLQIMESRQRRRDRSVRF